MINTALFIFIALPGLMLLGERLVQNKQPVAVYAKPSTRQILDVGYARRRFYKNLS